MTGGIRRIAGSKSCGNCYRLFKPFETVHYLGIDNSNYCAECREKLRPGEPDDPREQGGWVPSIFVGLHEEGHQNIMQLIDLWNELHDQGYSVDYQIDVKTPKRL